VRAPLAGPIVALLLASGCAHGVRWHRADLARLTFDGEKPSLVRVVSRADTLYMPHPVTRGDSLVGKYGYGKAVSLEEIDTLETYSGPSDGIAAGQVILLVVLGLTAALLTVGLIFCAEDDFC